MEKEEHEITIKQLCRLIGYHGNNHSAIRDALKGLISTVIEWNIVDDATGNENWTASSIIASVSLEGPMCYFAYSPRMKQLLHSPSMFGKIDLVIQSQFRSSYGLALYENCIRYRGLPHTKWFEMGLFKKLMGVPVDMYVVFRDFKRRVLDKAIDEVNMYSDLLIAPEFVKEGRKVVRVRFTLKERAKKTRLGTTKSLLTLSHTTDEALKDTLLTQYGLTDQQYAQLMTDYTAEFIREKMAVVESSKPYQEGKVQNLTGYLISALKHDYKLPKGKHEVVNLQDRKQEMELSGIKREIEQIRVQYQQYREETILQGIETLLPSDKQNFMTRFVDFAEKAVVTILRLQRHKYTRKNVYDAPQIKALLRQFAIRELDQLTMMPIEEFVASCHPSQLEAWQKLKSQDPDHPLLKFAE